MSNTAPKGGQNIIKGDEITPEALERGYRAYASIRDEDAIKSLVKSEWEGRYSDETTRALEVQKSKDYSGQIEALKAEIANVKTENTEIQKSATAIPQSSIRVPTHEEYAAMGTDLDSWRATEALARRALSGE
jgi:hypothetical protein